MLDLRRDRDPDEKDIFSAIGGVYIAGLWIAKQKRAVGNAAGRLVAA